MIRVLPLVKLNTKVGAKAQKLHINKYDSGKECNKISIEFTVCRTEAVSSYQKEKPTPQKFRE